MALALSATHVDQPTAAADLLNPRVRPEGDANRKTH